MSEKTKRKKRKNFWCFLVLVAAIFITDFQGKKLGYFLTGHPHIIEQIMKKVFQCQKWLSFNGFFVLKAIFIWCECLPATFWLGFIRLQFSKLFSCV